jgi:hypothetical protein
VVAGGTVARRSTAVFVYPSLEVVVEPLGPFAAGLSGVSGFEPVLVWDHVKGRVADYLAAYGRPEQIAAWRDGQPYVASWPRTRPAGSVRRIIPTGDNTHEVAQRAAPDARVVYVDNDRYRSGCSHASKGWSARVSRHWPPWSPRPGGCGRGDQGLAQRMAGLMKWFRGALL